MAIGTNDAIDKFGTLSNLASSSAAVVDAAFSVAGDLVTFTNTNDAKEAVAVLTWQYPSGTLDAGATVSLHARRLDWTGTTDEEVPSTDYSGAYIGSFSLDDGLAVTTDSYSVIRIPLLNSKSAQEYEFYIQNNSGVQITAGWTIDITPVAVGPKA